MKDADLITDNLDILETLEETARVLKTMRGHLVSMANTLRAFRACGSIQPQEDKT